MILLDENKKYFKTNLHCHTTLSDGAMTPEEIKTLYISHGYSIVAFTDHEIMYDCSYLTDDSFLALKGYEMATNNDRITNNFLKQQSAHFNFIAKSNSINTQIAYNKDFDWLHSDKAGENVKSIIKGYDRQHTTEDFNKLIEIANENDFLVIYNHPAWSLHNYNNYCGLKGLFGVEVYNTSSVKGGYLESDSVYDDLLINGNRLFPICADDNHCKPSVNFEASDCCKGFLNIQAEKLDYCSVISALKNGNFYSSFGPEFYGLKIENYTLIIKCSPVINILVIGKGRAKISRFPKYECDSISEISIELNEAFSDYFRVVLVDKCGNKAFSNAFFGLNIGAI